MACEWMVHWFGLEGAWHVNGWYIGFGWKVHGMKHGKRCVAFFYTPVSIRKVLSKRKAFLVPGCGM